MKTKVLWCVATLLVGAVTAQNLDALQQRMVARKAAVAELLATQTVGENNKGYLEELKPLDETAQRQTLTAENNDRKAVYAAIATRTGATAEAVGRSRAREIAKIARVGTMVQQDDGAWSAKIKKTQ